MTSPRSRFDPGVGEPRPTKSATAVAVVARPDRVGAENPVISEEGQTSHQHVFAWRWVGLTSPLDVSGASFLVCAGIGPVYAGRTSNRPHQWIRPPSTLALAAESRRRASSPHRFRR
jgi:hypothetical protein